MRNRSTATANPARATSAVVPTPRQRRAGWNDLRLWVGIATVLLAVVGGALFWGGDDDTVSVWQTTRALGAGSVPVAVQPVNVPRELATEYASALKPLDGRLAWPLPAGTLVPSGAVTESNATWRQVTVGVDRLHAPVDLQPGDVVDVWVTAEDGFTSLEPVLSSVVVVDIGAEVLTLGGEIAVVLDVQERDVAVLVSATRTGKLDLVAAGISGSGEALG